MTDPERVSLIREGNVFLNQGKFAEALKCFRQADYKSGMDRISEKLLEANQIGPALSLMKESGSTAKIETVTRSLAEAISMMLMTTSEPEEPESGNLASDPPNE